jgi:hypothetical protein
MLRWKREKRRKKRSELTSGLDTRIEKLCEKDR